MTTYFERLKDPRWQRRRLEILQMADFACSLCESKEKTLHVHHRLYRKGAMPWEYTDSELQCLCEDCHELTTRVRKSLDSILAKLDWEQVAEILGYAQGMEAMYSDEESAPNCSWEITCYGHAAGFATALACSPDLMAIESLLTREPATLDNVRQLLAYRQSKKNA